MNAVRLVVSILLALPAGWFAGVLVDRIPERLPLWDPVKPLRLRGRDLVVQLLVLVLFVIGGLRFADATWGELLAYLGLFTVLAALAVIDIEHYRLPDLIVLPSLVVSIAWVAVVLGGERRAGPDPLPPSSARALYFGFLFLAHLISPAGHGLR